MRILLATLTLVAALAVVPASQAADPWYVQAGATWSQSYISEQDGTTLHADVLRPANLPATAKTPVILSIGPYFNHSGQEGPAGAASGLTYDPVAQNGPQPSDRFADFVEGSHLLQKGYTYVMVDLRGFGGSSGCLDWAGPGEQADVKAAVQWAATQPWSTGSVGMYGKSYDGVTGLIGEVQQPTGLKAIVSQEPVYDLYNYLYTNGVRFENSVATPALYDGIAATPGPATDSAQYQEDAINDTQRPGCPVLNWSDQALTSDHNAAYWQPRNLIRLSHGHKIPMFMTQGFLENNTKPEGAWDFFNGLAGPKQAWFGMWDHIRGNDVAEGDNAAPHPWFDEVMRWYDHYLKGQTVTPDPPISVETSDSTGHTTWRAEKRWPPADSLGYTTHLTPGTYNDQYNDGSAEGNGPPDTLGQGVWTISKALPYAAHFAGVPRVSLDVTPTVPSSDLSVDLYDIDANDNALLLSRTAYLLGSGENKISAEMYGNDWQIPAGHRLGVLVTSANGEWWTPTPTQMPVTVNSGTITLPFLRRLRTSTLSGMKVPARLSAWLSAAPFAVPPATVSAATTPNFVLPPPQK